MERRVAAAPGTTRIVASQRGRAAPGDRLGVEVGYRNAGAVPIADLVLADPVPAALAHRSTVPGAAAPELSVDGVRFAALADLSVRCPAAVRAPPPPTTSSRCAARRARPRRARHLPFRAMLR